MNSVTRCLNSLGLKRCQPRRQKNMSMNTLLGMYYALNEHNGKQERAVKTHPSVQCLSILTACWGRTAEQQGYCGR